jgi:hypothetical protein
MNAASVARLMAATLVMWSFALAGTSHAGPSPIPEIDPGSAGSVLALVMGSLALLERRRSL